MDISILISTWNNAKRLQTTLEWLSNCHRPKDCQFEVIIVNNNCTDNTNAVLADYAKRLPLVVVSESVQGLSRARNTGLANAQGQWIIFTDDDVKPCAEWLTTYWEAINKYPTGYFLGGPIESDFEGTPPSPDLLKYTPPSVSGLTFGPDERQLKEKEFFVSANWACRIKDIQSAGGFDITKGLNPANKKVSSGEEAAVMNNLRKSGIQGIYLPKAHLLHFVPTNKCTIDHFRQRWQALGYETAKLEIEAYLIGKRLFNIPLWMWKGKIQLLITQWTKKILGKKHYGEEYRIHLMDGKIDAVKESVKSGNLGKIRIAYHTNAIAIGGSDLYLSYIINSINFDQFDVTLFCTNEYPVEKLYPNLPQLKIIRFHVQNTSSPSKSGSQENITNKKANSVRRIWDRLPVYSLKLFVGLCKEIVRDTRLLRPGKFHIFHSNDGGPEPMLIAADLAGIPVILASYCVLPDPPNERKEGKNVRRFFEVLSARCINKGIVKTQATKSLWVQHLHIDDKKVSVVFNGLDLASFKPTQPAESLKEELNIPLHYKVIGLTARLHPMKGHKVLIQAMPKILAKHPNTMFVFVGEGEIKTELEKLIKELQLTDHVRFAGFRSDIATITNIYDIGLLPSVAYETFGWALIESMACKKPVVASRFSGIPEIVDDGITGILVPPGESQPLADAILYLLDNPDKAFQMGKEGRIKVEQLFTREVMLQKTFDLYYRILKRKPSNSIVNPASTAMLSS